MTVSDRWRDYLSRPSRAAFVTPPSHGIAAPLM